MYIECAPEASSRAVWWKGVSGPGSGRGLASTSGAAGSKILLQYFLLVLEVTRDWGDFQYKKREFSIQDIIIMNKISCIGIENSPNPEVTLRGDTS